MIFRDREDAAAQLAAKLKAMRLKDPIIMAIPRGGVITGEVIARALGARLDVIVSRKVGAPGNPELAIGAVAPDGAFFPNREALIALGIPEEFARRAAAIVSEEVERRLERFRGSKKYDLKGRTIVIVDDGIATGATMFAAVEWAGRQSPKRLIVAVPVGPKETLERLSGLAEVVALQSPTLFMAVGEFYTLFDQVADERVVEIMRSHGYALKP